MGRQQGLKGWRLTARGPDTAAYLLGIILRLQAITSLFAFSL